MAEIGIGSTFGPYEIIEYIGRGPIATVYEARQRSIGRLVALKVMEPAFAKDPSLVDRFRREVELTAELQHPRILPVYDYGEIDERFFITMAYMPGGSVHRLIGTAGAISLPAISRIVDQTADALDYAHDLDVIHRDVKPTNLLLDRRGNVHLAEFGTANKVLGDVHNTIIGTLAYMAPEVFMDDAATPAVDIYSLGITLYEMLTGETPFTGASKEIIKAQLDQPIPDPREKYPDLSDAISEVVLKATAKDPADRYGSAGELSEALDDAIGDRVLAHHRRIEREESPAKPKSRIFVSYARSDQEFVGRLVSGLSQHGISTWTDMDIRPGQNWNDAIDEALNTCDRMIVVISNTSMASESVKAEWQYYLTEVKRPVVPVRYQDAKIPFHRLAALQYVDFLKPSYEDALRQLITALGDK